MIKNTAISVIMSVYNTQECFLRPAIESILNQSFKDFEFIIVTDAPTDGSELIVNEYAKKDSRIVVLTNEQNIGLTKSLNKALDIAKGTYIARMDADDYSVPNRFEKQYSFLENNPDVGVVGGHVYTGIKSSRFMTFWNKNADVAKAKMLFHNAGVPHPTAMFRKQLKDGTYLRYDEKILKSQDFALWSSCIYKTRIVMLNEIMLIYRIHDGQITATPAGQIKFCGIIIENQLNSLFGITDKTVCSTFADMFVKKELVSFDSINSAFNALKLANSEHNTINKKVLNKTLIEMLFEYLYINRNRLNKAEKKLLFKNTVLSSPLCLFRFYNQYIAPRREHDRICKSFKQQNADLIKQVLS